MCTIVDEATYSGSRHNFFFPFPPKFLQFVTFVSLLWISAVYIFDRNNTTKPCLLFAFETIFACVLSKPYLFSVLPPHNLRSPGSWNSLHSAHHMHGHQRPVETRTVLFSTSTMGIMTALNGVIRTIVCMMLVLQEPISTLICSSMSYPPHPPHPTILSRRQISGSTTMRTMMKHIHCWT